MTSFPAQLERHVRNTIGFTKLVPGLYRHLDYPDVGSLAMPTPMLVINGGKDALFEPTGVRASFEKLAAATGRPESPIGSGRVSTTRHTSSTSRCRPRPGASCRSISAARHEPLRRRRTAAREPAARGATAFERLRARALDGRRPGPGLSRRPLGDRPAAREGRRERHRGCDRRAQGRPHLADARDAALRAGRGRALDAAAAHAAHRRGRGGSPPCARARRHGLRSQRPRAGPRARGRPLAHAARGVRDARAGRRPPAGQRGIHVLGQLAQQGLICHGPRRDRQPTFVLLEEWILASKSPSREEALATLARATSRATDRRRSRTSPGGRGCG